MARGLALTCILVLVAVTAVFGARTMANNAVVTEALATNSGPAVSAMVPVSDATPLAAAAPSNDADFLDPMAYSSAWAQVHDTEMPAVAETQAAPATVAVPEIVVAPAVQVAPAAPARTAAPQPVATPAPTAAPVSNVPATCPATWFCYPRLGISGPIVPYTDCSGSTDVGTGIRSYNCLSDHYLMGHAYTQFGQVRQWAAGDIVFAWGQRFTVSGAVTQQSCGAPSFPLATLSMQTSLTSSSCGAVLVVQAR